MASDFKKLKSRALALLSKREHSRQELSIKLSPHADSPEELTPLLDYLEQEGWLSDQRRAESIVRQKQHQYGPLRLAAQLTQKGISKDLQAQVLEEHSAHSPEAVLEIAYQLWLRKFNCSAETMLAKNRQIQYLLRRGFDYSTALKVLAKGPQT